ncbi:MlaA family lipoprotein [Tabrizicola thermarum]|uniref:MlaA family lipoprotein n=1 Tax=Tabrizicola thermarum TaxID=2670345 RepID=UPI00138FD88A|nr:VacJ family lipoprotein [Tabrizicola thermarum]
MGLKIPLISGRLPPIYALAVSACLAAGCAAPSGPTAINDPFEPVNRQVHGFNKAVDRGLVAPASQGVGSVPEPIRRGVDNLAGTLALPGDIANNLLQLRLADAAQNTLRLGVNLTFGLAGLLDVASEAGLEGKPTDFGETLHVWGVGEGPYLELPLAGPSTLRDTVGIIVDTALDPVNRALPVREATAALGIRLFSRLGDRSRFSATVDSILYDSADSYAQARLLYLQNRRFTLSRGKAAEGGDDAFIDPYEDPYAE